MAEAAEHMRAPESEIYGRSLSTIHRLGAFMVGKSLAEIATSPEAFQARAEFFTSVEEGFGTDMELGGGLEVRDFDMRQVIDGKVMSHDLKTAVSGMTEAGLKCAKEKYAREKAGNDYRFGSQLTRSKWDHENALIVDKMARGQAGYNTRIVVSPFPEEAAAESGDAYWRNIGYVPHLRRGFVQLYHATPEGEVIAGSLSFDGSDKQKLRTVFEQFGIEVPAGEITDNWLQYAITDTLSEDRAKTLAMMFADQLGDSKQSKATNTVDVTREYGKVMDTVFDKSYVHICESLFNGKQTDGLAGLVQQLATKAQHFNERYSSALYRMRADTSRFTDDDSIVLHELLVYSTIEMMRALHLEQSNASQASPRANLTAMHLQAADASLFQSMLGGYGAEGARNNRVYSACGIEINLGADSPELSPQSAFGGNADSAKDEESSEKKTMSCPFCTAKVFDDPCARVLKCWDCKAAVVDGRVVYKGDGGHKARQATREAEHKTQDVEVAKPVDEVSNETNVPEVYAEQSAQPGSKAAQLALSAVGV